MTLNLAAASTAAAAAFAIIATAIVEHVQLVHGIHLLSYRRLSIDSGKIAGQHRAALQSYSLMTLSIFSVAADSGANLTINCPQQTTIFS
jgi:hypothetical protein